MLLFAVAIEVDLLFAMNLIVLDHWSFMSTVLLTRCQLGLLLAFLWIAIAKWAMLILFQ